MTTQPNGGAVANLADVVAQVLNRLHWAGVDSTGQHMVSMRADLAVRLQRALAEVYPDDRDHNVNMLHALKRELRRA